MAEEVSNGLCAEAHKMKVMAKRKPAGLRVSRFPTTSETVVMPTVDGSDALKKSATSPRYCGLIEKKYSV